MKKTDKKQIEDILALTPMQEGLLFHYLHAPRDDSYFNQLDLEVWGDINPRYFEKAWNFVWETNEMLRTVFRWEKLEKPSQVVLKKHTLHWRYEDLSGVGDIEEQKKQWETIKQQDRGSRFDLRRVSFRVILGKMAQSRYQMLISNHHILYDGWSTGIILKEFFQAYAVLEARPTDGPAKPSFGEFIRWHQNRDRDKQKKFWEDYLQGFTAPTPLPVKRKAIKQDIGCVTIKEFSFVLEKGVKESLDHFLKERRITPAAFFYCAWGLLLQKYCNSGDVVFGTTVSGRSAPIPGIEHMVGLFINTLPLRVTFNTGESLSDLLLKVNEDLLAREKYENTPLVEIHRYSHREPGQELFDSLVVIENYPLDHFLKDGNKTLPLTVHSYSAIESTPYDLNIAITPHDRIEIRLIYRSEAFTGDVIARLSRHFSCILDEIMAHPDTPGQAVDILSPGEKKQLLLDFNETGPGFPADKTLHGLFAEQAKRTPERIALVGGCGAPGLLGAFGGTTATAGGVVFPVGPVRPVGLVQLTYTELNERSDGLAHLLIEKGAQPGTIVGIMVERSLEMMVGILGILKAGSAYVPLNPNAPAGRNDYMLTDSGANILLTANETNDQCPMINDRSKKYSPNDQCPMTNDQLAYIIYTSGSTGNPKGVPITHANFSPLVHWGYRHLGIGISDRSVQNLSYYFDWSVWEIFIALTGGASLYMVPGEVVMDAERYLDFLQRFAITVLHITPTHFQSLLYVSPGQRLKTLRYLCIGAEKLNCDLVERSYAWIHGDCRVFNMYGPTEATIMAAVLEIDKTKLPGYRELSSVPIGKNLGNNVLLVLDRHRHLCPLLVPGELYIGGDGIARGYLNNPEMTLEKFINYKLQNTNYKQIPNYNVQNYKPGGNHSSVQPCNHTAMQIAPHHPNTSIPNLPHSTYSTYSPIYKTGDPAGQDSTKLLFNHQLPLTIHHSPLYQTGDLARWLADGTVEFLGRMDQQVKIRGFRIEPGEIEKHLLEHREVKDALVTAGEYENGDKYLCAYVVPRTGCVPELSKVLKDRLSGFLPGYMVPAYFVTLERMPLNPNGKVDIKALPGPVVTSAGGYTAPGNDRERVLVDIWARVLGIDSAGIGIDDDFFRLGGHSLKVTAVIGRVHKELKIEVPFIEIFENPTVRKLAAYIGQQQESRYDEIPLAEEKEYYPLSSAQTRLVVLRQMDEGSLAYHIQGIMVLEGEVDQEKLQAVFLKIIARHESLRTSFYLVDNVPVQRITNQAVPFGQVFNASGEDLTTDYTDYTDYLDYPEKNTNTSTNTSTIIKSFIRPFDLSQAPLMRVGLVEIDYLKYLLVVDMHHIISDGYSLGILIREFMAFYQGENLPAMRLQYKDFSQWLNARRGSQALRDQENYWLKQFAGEVPVLNLPVDFPRPVVQVFEGAHTDFWVGKEDTAALQALALEEKTTLFGVLFSVYTIFLSRLSGQEDMVVGTPVTGRRHDDLTGVIGMFVNMLALRSFPEGDRAFRGFLEETGGRIAGALENQEYPFEDLVERLNLNRDASRNPLFDAAFAMQYPDLPRLEIPGLTVTPYEYDMGISKFDLTLIAGQEGERLHFTLQYCTKLFKAETIERYSGYFKQLVSSIAANPGQKISALEILSREEKHRLAYEFNETGAIYPNDKTIPGLFEEQVKKTPDYTALHGCMTAWMQGAAPDDNAALPVQPVRPVGPVQLTYIELDECSDGLAGSLIEKGVQPGAIVGIMMERSIDMIIGILGILKAGGAYLPIDPEAPEERVDYMLRDSNAVLVINEKFFAPLFYKKAGRRRHYISSKQTAYIIYTSGSSGTPKGVPITHANFSPLIHWGNRHLGIGAKDRVLQNLSYFFDWSVWEIFIVLTTGASLYMVTRDVIMDPGQCIEYIRKQALTVLHITPTHYRYLVNTGKAMETLRYLFIGAEKLTYDLVKRSIEAVGPACRIFNMYGPTEATIISAVLEIHRSCVEEYKELSSVPIGRPPGNIALWVLDKYLNLCPVKVAGELYIGGDAVAAGYLNNPELTREKFIMPSATKNPFEKGFPDFPKLLFNHHSPLTTHHSPIYRTGDLARWLLDGNVEYLGRMDFQVKIRGYRIELGEIENHLLEYPGIKEAAVIVKENPAREKYLCAYIVAGEDFDQVDLKSTLAGFLPDYMIPSYFIRMEKMPLNPNKKIDLKALPEPGLSAEQVYTAPGNEIEKKLVDIWSGLLDLERDLIGVDANFFQLGGHSLKATLLVGRIEKELQVKVPLPEIFITPTIRGLAEFITRSEAIGFESIEPVEKKEYYPISSAQGRLFVLQQMDEQGIGYNIPSIWQLEGNLDVEKFEKVFHGLIRRHESLRTSFHMVKDEPVQVIHDEVEFTIEYDWSLVNGQRSEVKGQWSLVKCQGRGGVSSPFIDSFLRPFDLTRAPLLRVGIIKQAGQKNLVMVDMHHIVTDGVSMRILAREFMDYYTGKHLPPLRLRYKDYVQWQERKKETPGQHRQAAYWQKRFLNEIPALELPTDFVRPKVRDFAGGSIHFEITPGETRGLKALALENGTTLYMVLLSIFNVFLAKLTGQEAIVVGTAVAGRRHADLQQIIGMFVNTLVLVCFPGKRMDFKEFLQAVNQATLEAFENQDYPFEKLVEKLDITRDTGRNPLFDVMFDFQPVTSEEIEIPGLKLGPYHHDSKISKFDLMLQAIDGKENLRFIFEYSTALFKEETIGRFTGYFKKAAAAVLERPTIKLSEIDILTAAEKQRLLYDLNGTGAVVPQEKTIRGLFKEQAARTPDHVALVSQVKDKRSLSDLSDRSDQSDQSDQLYISITYRELNERSGRLATNLLEKGVQPDTIVGIMVDPSVEMVVGIMGILKSGGAYMPIDPGYPEERKQYMLIDSGAKVLLSEMENFNCQLPIANYQLSMMSLEETGQCHVPEIMEASANNSVSREMVRRTFLGGGRRPLAYIIYTSGTTGKPKGCLVEHRNIAGLMKTGEDLFHYDHHDTWTMFHSFCFDFSVWEMYGALLYGGKLVLIPRLMARDPRAYLETLKKQGVTILNQTPTVFYQVTREEMRTPSKELHLRFVIFGGEALKPAGLQTWKEKYPETRLINMYGITETTVHVTFKEITSKEIAANLSNIGKPISTLWCGIINRDFQLVPMNVPGELVVGGGGVARGYLNRPELTEKKFLYNRSYWSYRSYIKLYRTGDLVRLIEDGEMEYLGRLDHQVKIRGNRVETGEIEAQLMQVQGVKEALVQARQKENGDTYLCAYLKSAPGREPNPSELRAALSKNLPDYMIPSYFIPLEEFPLTESGKVDRRKLPQPGELRPNLETAYTAPGTGLATTIAEAWKEVLKVEKVGIHDNFFDLGGTSLDIVRLDSRLKEVLGIEIPVVTLFEYPTIHAFLGHIQPMQEQAAGHLTETASPKEPGLDTTGKLHPPGDQIKRNEIAVIGMAGRFPGAGSIPEFWENLRQGRESIYFFSEEEINEAGASPAQAEDLDYVKAKGVLEEAAYFDAAFFNYTLQEAGIMDPQLRLLHESAWQALEDAGLDPGTYEGSIGVYVGASTHAYWISRVLNLGGTPSANFGAISVNDGYSYSTQLAYRLNLKGPAVTIQTACSTSLVAIHLASRALLNEECEVALAGGVSLLLPIKTGYRYQAGMVQSRDGHCRAFDANATGTVGGNGIALVVLKSLDRALEDRDHIYALVKGTAMNNDGNRKVGYTAPSVKGQAEVIRKAQQAAGAAPGTITYIETHGTGTGLGDPVEIRALVQAFEVSENHESAKKKGEKFCRIGSVKSNVGHLDAAAGGAGFIKTVLALYHRAIPPTLHYETPNPEIDFENSPFMVNTTLYDWNLERERKPLRAGVSSFGIGGTNAHVVLEEWPGEHQISQKLLEVQPRGAGNLLGSFDTLLPFEPWKSPFANRLPMPWAFLEKSPPGRRRHINLLLVSARSFAALERNTYNLVEYLRQNPQVDFVDVEYTLQVGRKAFANRRALVCGDAAEAVEILSAGKSKKVYTHEVIRESPPVIFMLAGLGSQYVNMGRGLYDTEPVYRREIDRCFRILEPLLDYDIKEILYPEAAQPGKPGGSGRTIDQPAVSQVAIFVFEYALAQLVMSWGIKPYALIGYSFGEYTAACIAGVFSLEDAITLIVHRGKLVEETPEGGMLSVPLTREEIRPLLSDRENLYLAIDNGETCVVSGMKSAVDAFEISLKEKKVLSMRIPTNYALHSALMEKILPGYAARLEGISMRPPRYRYISNVTGQWITDSEATDPGYWSRHLAQTVEFARGISELVKEPGAVFLELGPGRDLTVQVRRYLKENQQVINLARPQERTVSDQAYLLDRLGRLWCWGSEIDWKGYYWGRDRERTRQSLPTYSFERQGFHLEGRGLGSGSRSEATGAAEPDQVLYPEASITTTTTTYRRPTLPGDFESPRDEIEKKIAAQFQEIFGVSPIGIHEDFFEMGGDSLKVITLVTQLHRELGLDIPMEAVFRNPTVEEIAAYARQIRQQAGFAVIPAVERKEYYPLASPQRRVFILDQIEEKSRPYQMPTVLWLKGVLDITHLERAFRSLLERHEALRTGFFLEKGEPVQRVYSMDEIEFSLEYSEVEDAVSCGQVLDACGEEPKSQELRAKSYIDHFFRPFELSRPPLWRVGIVKVEVGKYLLMQNLHHIISDDISIGIMMTELAMLLREESGSPAPLPVQYKDYAVWQQKNAAEKILEEQKTFWLGRYPVGGMLPVLGMPYDNPRPPVQTFEGAQIQAKPGDKSGEAWQTLARDQKTTFFVLLFTAYQVLLHSYTHQEDIIVGIPITGRSHRDVQQVVGMFVNTLAIRTYPRAHRRFEDFLQEVKEETLAAFAHQLYPFEDLVERLNLPRDISRNPLFDTMFVLHTVDLGKIDIPGVTLTPYELDRRAAKFDITLNAAETTMGLNLELEYNTSLFKPDTMQRFLEDYIFILETVSSDPGIQLGEIKTYHAKKRGAEKKRILYEFNCRGAGFPGESTLHGMFEEQAERAPDRIALEGQVEDRSNQLYISITYRELNERSGRLAEWLMEQGVRPDAIVGIMVERSMEMVIGIMGILKSGGAYMPIDPGYPEERKKYLLADSGVKLLVTTDKIQSAENINRSHSSYMSYTPKKITAAPLAYIIYTSGSTGKPKGVMVEHRSVVNVLNALAMEYPLGENDTYLLKTSFLFDVSVSELFGWYRRGARLAVLEKDGEIDPGKLLESIERYRVTHINFVPSMFSLWVDHLKPGEVGRLSGLRYIFLAGEALQPQPVEKFRGLVPGVQLENLYGPTEAAIYASRYSLRDWNSSGSETKIPIGRPLSNVNLYVLDHNMQMQGIGVAGELGISGEGVARGYLNRPGLTAERFLDIKIAVRGENISILDSSYRSYRSNKSYKSSIKLYKTGDLARWLPGGDIEYLGRIDHQVKVRGNRVELGEIEYHLLRHPEIKEAVVVAREDEKREVMLWAYMVTDREMGPAEVREFLARGVPDYMIPAYYIRIPRFSYTTSGKIDRGALPKVEGMRSKTGVDYVTPGTELEKVIAGVWQEELKMERVGVNDNFMDLGGTSLKVIRVAARLKEVIGREVPVVMLFRYPTVRSLAGFLSQGGPGVVFRDRAAVKQKGRERLNKKRGLK